MDISDFLSQAGLLIQLAGAAYLATRAWRVRRRLRRAEQASGEAQAGARRSWAGAEAVGILRRWPGEEARGFAAIALGLVLQLISVWF